MVLLSYLVVPNILFDNNPSSVGILSLLKNIGFDTGSSLFTLINLSTLSMSISNNFDIIFTPFIY